VICGISDPQVIEEAIKLNKTRAQTSMRLAAKQMNHGIVAIGNAPTALTEVTQMIKEGITSPALVIGIPVGFVCAVESKDELRTINVSYITNIGRKGGSPCASAIVNALYKILASRTKS
jgi:precorrin-8X/cobalt-precorrin-8 methylmutase